MNLQKCKSIYKIVNAFTQMLIDLQKCKLICNCKSIYQNVNLFTTVNPFT